MGKIQCKETGSGTRINNFKFNAYEGEAKIQMEALEADKDQGDRFTIVTSCCFDQVSFIGHGYVQPPGRAKH